MKKIAKILAFGLLTGCSAGYTDPVVTGYNGDSVVLEVEGHAAYVSIAEQRQSTIGLRARKAEDICSRGHKKHAEYVSVNRYWQLPRTLSNAYTDRTLFLCLNPG